jgi:NADH-quinone oxidoreductase subunit J
LLENSIFYILALFLIGGSLGMITFRQSVFSAISFLLAMIALSGMFALLHQSFLFLAQILVSVGAIVTLALLVIVSVNIKEENLPHTRLSIKKVITMILLILPISVLIFYGISKSNLQFATIDENFGSLSHTGQTLFTKWALPFEIIAILLLVALVGGILISKRGANNES